MKNIAIIGASEFQNPLILKAKEMGFITHVFAWECNDIGEKTADKFYPISITEKEKIYEKCKEIGIDAIVSIGSDLAVHTVNYVSRHLGLLCNSEQSERCSTDKYEMRKAFKKASVWVPRFIEATSSGDAEMVKNFRFPVIVKPTDRSGSRGITKVYKYEDLADALDYALEYSYSKRAIIEEFIDGDEYSCECISFAGKHHFLAFTKKYTTDAPHFIETGHVEPSDIPEVKQLAIIDTVFKALDSLDIRYGASHSEFRIDKDGNARIIEIGARMGGDCIGSDLVQISTGYDFLKMVIDVACGNEPIIEPTSEARKAEIMFFFSERDMEYAADKLKDENTVLWRRSEKIEITGETITDSSNRYGYFIFSSK